ncbi:MAG TPA: DUF5602 domain-containing protein [Longimicrobiales bacterium]
MESTFGIYERARRNGMPAVLLTLAAVVVGGSVAATRRADDGMIYGAPVAIGNGTARVYIDLKDGAPVEVGVALTVGALEGLPDHHSTGGVALPDGHRMFEQILTMPAQNPTPYRYVALGWNPGGHEPPGIYDHAHFDFHFYTAPESQRALMDPARAEYEAEAALNPAAEYVPSGFVTPPDAVVPFMGSHWIDPTSPEFNGGEFTRTFLYGSWNGEIIFAEPMITRAFLQTRTDVTQEVAVAARQLTPGWYPGSYRVRWVDDAREYRVGLTGFEWHQ